MTKTIKLSLIQNRICGITETTIDPKDFLLNDCASPEDIARWGTKPYCIGNEHGALCVVWAGNEQEAFDEAADADKLDSMLVDNVDWSSEDSEDCVALGNASEAFDLTYAWVNEVNYSKFTADMWYQIGNLYGEADTLEG